MVDQGHCRAPSPPSSPAAKRVRMSGREDEPREEAPASEMPAAAATAIGPVDVIESMEAVDVIEHIESSHIGSSAG